MSPGSAYSASSSMSITPICAVLAASSNCFSSRSIASSSSLISRAWGMVIGVRPVNSYLAASSSTWYLSPSRSISCTSCRANGLALVVDADTRAAPGRRAAPPRPPGGSALAELRRAAASPRPSRWNRLAAAFLHALGLVGFQDLPLPLAEHLHQGFEARPQAGDLAGIELDRPGQFLVGQFAHVAVGQHVLEGPRDQVGRRLRRAGEVLRVVLLVGVDDAARSGLDVVVMLHYLT